MAWANGILGGFAARKSEYAAEQLKLAEAANAREAKVFELLANSPDPEIQSMAISGLLSSAQPQKRSGGLRGWLGEMSANPMTAKIRGMIDTPVESQEPNMGLPSKQYSGYLTGQPTAEAPLAQPSTSATEVGAPPLSAVSPSPTPAAPAGPSASAAPAAPAAAGAWAEQPATPSGGTHTVSKPRQILMSPEEAAAMPYRGRVRGTIQEMETAMGRKLTPEEAKQIGLEISGYSGVGSGGAGAFQSTPGEMPDGTPAYGVFDRARGEYIDPRTKQPLVGFRPRTTTGSTSMGADRESISREMFGKRAAALTPAEMAAVNKRVQEFGGEKAGAVESGRGGAAAGVPLSTQQRFQATTDLSKQWTTERTAGREMERQFKLMQVGATRYDADPIGASQAVLVTFQKILDPSSVVRESEYARSPQGLSLVDRLQGMYERYSAGGAGVPKPVLDEMVKTAEQLLIGVKGASDAVRQRIQDTATSYEIDPRLVLGADVGAAGTPPPAVAAPPPGAPGKTTLDHPAPGYFVDADGNLIRR